MSGVGDARSATVWPGALCLTGRDIGIVMGGAGAPSGATDQAAADFPAVIGLATLDGSNGFRLDGVDAGDTSGVSVSSAGDVNGDGFDDIIIGAQRSDPDGDSEAGESYVVFGKAREFGASLDLATLDGRNGFRLDGVDFADRSGVSVSTAGDVNGDGFDDIIIGAYDADPDGERQAGESYVVFGKAGAFDASLDLALLDGSNGFRLDGPDGTSRTGSSVSAAGDVNGDGFGDIIIGSLPVGAVPGESYVVFGKADGFAADLDLDALDGSNGFRIKGIRDFDLAGSSVSEAGDINDDGFGDIIIGAIYGGPEEEGESYVLFGKADGFAPSLDLAGLDGANGFRVFGGRGIYDSGWAVSSAGDVNGDGFADVIIGAPGPSRYDDPRGASYIVFGQAGGFSASFDLAGLDGSNGFRLDGVDPYDFSGIAVSSAGDVNGDGFDDVIIGANNADPGGDLDAGESYVVFGKAGGFAARFDLASLDGGNGFRLDGTDSLDSSGSSVSAAGDVNRDGFDDIIIAAPFADHDGADGAGESYVIFGRTPTTAVLRVGAEGDQAIRGGDFDDTLRGEGGSDSLVGGRGADLLDGGEDVDVLRGAHCDDMLRGGGGRDIVNGGVGADRIAAPGSFDRAAADVIYRFESGVDEIALAGAVFGLAPGAFDADSFVISNRAQDADDRLIYKADSGKLYFDPDGTGAQAQVLIATLVGAPGIDAGDFIVI